jgi:hypothetical protein
MEKGEKIMALGVANNAAEARHREARLLAAIIRPQRRAPTFAKLSTLKLITISDE